MSISLSWNYHRVTDLNHVGIWAVLNMINAVVYQENSVLSIKLRCITDTNIFNKSKRR